LHSMQRSASHKNFILAMLISWNIRVRYALAIWQRVVLVSCIMVTMS
jgi:hypothetical protein